MNTNFKSIRWALKIIPGDILLILRLKSEAALKMSLNNARVSLACVHFRSECKAEEYRAAFHLANASQTNSNLSLCSEESQFHFGLQRGIHHFPPAQTRRLRWKVAGRVDVRGYREREQRCSNSITWPRSQQLIDKREWENRKIHSGGERSME